MAPTMLYQGFFPARRLWCAAESLSRAQKLLVGELISRVQSEDVPFHLKEGSPEESGDDVHNKSEIYTPAEAALAGRARLRHKDIIGLPTSWDRESGPDLKLYEAIILGTYSACEAETPDEAQRLLKQEFLLALEIGPDPFYCRELPRTLMEGPVDLP